ncbi:MAG: hypothetical protein ABSD78_14090 [Acidimicrobiales bacterium]|jgi:hypothetical protein
MPEGSFSLVQVAPLLVVPIATPPFDVLCPTATHVETEGQATA